LPGQSGGAVEGTCPYTSSTVMFPVIDERPASAAVVVAVPVVLVVVPNAGLDLAHSLIN
jgi:hypothetical protein